ncbi:MAG TPA: GDSL-type esterase/lipase family protein, partial [Acidimicrobiales bacterium]|nr:GDSL-type esterase/lipase family protein [Acidimicrobiales bacterium]
MRKTAPARRWRALLTVCAAALVGAVLPMVVPADPADAVTITGRYVALGDSYTAGPLIPDNNGEPLGCLRSDENYPQEVARAYGVSVIDASCSGAETEDMTQPQGVTPGPNPPQFDRLTPDTQVVTVGIGGNDIGFSSIVQNCVALLGDFERPCKDDYVVNDTDQLANRIGDTADDIAAVLEGIHTRSPLADVYLVGYPAILPESGGCWPQMPLTSTDVAYLRDTEKRLNTMLAQQAALHGATYVDVYTPSIGHDACTSSSVRWVEPIVPGNVAASVHPNARGMEGMAAAVKAAIDATPIPPSAPQALSATPGNAQVGLSWSAPASNGGSPVTAYRVYRDGVLVHTTANGTTTTFTDTGRTNGQAYAYRVSAVTAAGEGPKSSQVSATPRTVPTAPQAVNTQSGDNEVTLGWSAPASNGGASISAYRVYRDDALVHTTADASTFEFVDSPLANNQTVTYEVAAVNVAGEGARSAAVDATPSTGCCPPHGFSDVGPADFFDDAVAWAKFYGVVTGFQVDNTYRPDNPVNRGQIVSMLWHLMDEPGPSPHHAFPDVPPNAWYDAALDWARAAGHVTGFPSGNYEPKDPVRRAQLVTML